ncbi:out at first protein-like isoform X2 [Paramacrobiotus metropolitanus]|uniref:out at first protein-like isoform X2 n=1 Tax=Paramacrobiotus metropolitanus TaxID=2943436 RepID=UPI002445CD07|nr:out at first protein-like isoform X2 [Paramacrobiotus metropolitanus]
MLSASIAIQNNIVFVWLWSGFLMILNASSEPLVVNIANKGGDVLQETFDANVTDDTIKLSFKQFDGTSINHLIDFPTAMQGFHLLLPPTTNKGQMNKQEFCFIVPLGSEEYISSDAISKLRQKNPHTVRRPEEELPPQSFYMQATFSSVSVSHAFPLCRRTLVQTFFLIPEESLAARNTTLPTKFEGIPACDIALGLSGQPCVCSYNLCIVWYPCGLKFCQTTQPNGEIVSYRCGIKTCKKCRQFLFVAQNRLDCPPEFYV